MNIESPEPPCLFRLRLSVHLSPQVLQTDGRLCHLVLASQCCRKIVNSRVPLLPRHYPSSSLSTDPSATLSPSTHFPVVPGYRAYLPPEISSWGEEGFSSCLAYPCHRAVATTPPESIAVSIRFRLSILPSPYGCRLGLRVPSLSGPPMRSLSLRPGDSLTIPSMALSMSFRHLIFLLPAIQATGLLILSLTGLTPVEYASLCWTHNRTCSFPAYGSSILHPHLRVCCIC